MADEQAALLAQIKALSGAIDQRKSSSSSSQAGYQAQGRGRGRGRGAGVTSGSSRHRTLILSGAAANGSSSAGDSKKTVREDASSGDNSEEGWIKRKSTHNMSLVSRSAFEKTEPARLAAMAATQTAKAAALQAKPSTKMIKSKGKSHNSVRRGDRMGEVIVDGVVFEFDESGTKLVKKDPQPTSETSSIPSASDTPLRTSVDGQNFIRTKTGNLISQELLDRRREARKNSERLKRLGEMGKDIGSHQRMRDSSSQKSKSKKVIRKRGLCSFYNKTGQCKRGLSCPYTHNPDKVAICPGILRPSGCILPPGSCPLSHDKKPERMPHCVHFLRLGSCRNGDECMYTHPDPNVNLSNESPICMDFSDLGWCERSASCPERHTWDCPEFLRKGSCSRKGCKLMHVIRGENLKQREDEEEDEHELADDDLFVRDDEGADVGQKRKRQGDSEESELDDEREQSPTWKAKKTKEFARQQDFISFANEEGGEVEEGDDNDEEEESHESDSDERESVHSDSSQD